MNNEHDSAERDPIVLLAADEAFAMPLAVTVRSILDNLSSDRNVTLYIIEGGILDKTKERLLRSWMRTPAPDVHWLSVSHDALAGLGVSDHVSLATYYRILTARLLPESVDRTIYLDADLIVQHDLGELWDSHLQTGQWCLAVQDFAAPYLDARLAMPNFADVSRYVAVGRPIRNYAELELDAKSPYFNGGVLLIDTAAWRREDMTSKLLECLHVNREQVLWWDQYALNVVLANHWGQLDPRWNQGSHLYEYPTWKSSPFDQATFEILRRDPYIVHFSSPVKPWQMACRHPFRRKFFQYLDRTDWTGWRPEQGLSLSERWQWKKTHFKSLLREWKRRGRTWWDEQPG